MGGDSGTLSTAGGVPRCANNAAWRRQQRLLLSLLARREHAAYAADVAKSGGAARTSPLSFIPSCAKRSTRFGVKHHAMQR